jgi:hypothetical protein
LISKSTEPQRKKKKTTLHKVLENRGGRNLPVHWEAALPGYKNLKCYRKVTDEFLNTGLASQNQQHHGSE